MKLARPVRLVALTTFTLTNIIFSCPPVWANDYGELEVDQNQFIAVAVPFGNRQYNLMVIEQIAGQQKCWSESGSQPVTVEPLLLDFDFSGSCRRATDSNGYSIRIKGQDYGLNYLLSIVERDGELLLIGIPRSSNSHLSEVLVGKSYGLNQGLNKILLNPGWRFTKRTFEEQALGHIYLTSDGVAMNHSETSTATTLTAGATTEPEITYLAPIPDSPLLPSTSTETSSPQPRSTLPAASADSPTPNPHLNNFPDYGVERLLVPDTPIPVSTQDNSDSIPVATKLTATSYRVIVKVDNSSQASQVRSLYPQAFNIVYQGQSMLQVGSFSWRHNAENTVENLQNLGWEGMILEN